MHVTHAKDKQVQTQQSNKQGWSFAENEKNSWKTHFDFGNGYFDNDYDQTLIWDDILMEIMVNFAEIR